MNKYKLLKSKMNINKLVNNKYKPKHNIIINII